MYKRIKTLLNTQTVRQSSITTISTFASAGLGAVFYLVLARVLGSSEYGLFTLCLTILITIVTVADVGMGQGIIRFIGEHRNSEKYLGYANFALKTKIVLGVVSWVGLMVFSSTIARLLGQPSLQRVLPVVGFGVFSYVLASYAFTMLQAMQKFVVWGGLQIGSNLVRLMFLWILSWFTRIDAYSALLVFSLTSFISFVLSWFWLDRKIFSAPSSKDHAFHFWDFNKWTASFSMLSAVVSRLDIFLASKYLSLSTVGTYSLAVTMVSFLPQLSVAIGAVTSAKFANKSDGVDARNYLKKASIFSTLIGLGVSLLMVPTAYIVVYFAGSEYLASLAPFLVLLLAQIVFMAGNPLRDFILYFMRTPKIFFWTAVVQGIVILAAGTWLIPIYQTSGIAISVLISQIVLGFMCLVYFFHNKNR
ncbi:MAG: oligosaccharide flippase family protein [Patescibacteria group bacterium]